jgi:hypothetical protein
MSRKSEQTSETQPTPVRLVVFAVYALCGLGMAVSAWLPYRVLTMGSTEITFTGMQFTENLAWILAACGVGSMALGIVGLVGRRAPAYAVLIPPATGLVFAGFFLLLFFQMSPTHSGQKYVLVTDLLTWQMIKSQDPRAALGLGLMLTAVSSVVMAALAYPVFRMFRSGK